jgi:Holliday junction resolvase RusA-like endonuclease
MHSRSLEIRNEQLALLGDRAREKAARVLAALVLDNPWRAISAMVLVEPMAQPRPRSKAIFKGGKFLRVQVYDPPESDAWKEAFGESVRRILPARFPVKGPIEIRAKVYKAIPLDYSEGLRYLCEAGEVRPEKKPDSDNYVKAIKDALTGVAWVDDSQSPLVECEKFYSAIPRVEFSLRYRERPMDKIGPRKEPEPGEAGRKRKKGKKKKKGGTKDADT